MIHTHGSYDLAVLPEKLCAQFATAPLICPCGVKSVVVIIDPENYRDGPILAIPIAEIDAFTAQLQLVAAQLQGKVQ